MTEEPSGIPSEPEATDVGFLVAPFPYFGGKSRVAPDIWSRFGDADNYVEPFCGSAAMLLGRPQPFGGVETINDKSAYVANFWRAAHADHEMLVDAGLDWPVNETDLEARHKWLVTAARKREHAERMRDDPDYYDARIAAYWCWGAACWIGAGWCSGEWNGRGGDNSGRGVNVKDETRGGQLPHLGAGRGECERRRVVLLAWIGALTDRLRNVRVCCGDWLRAVKSDTTTTKHGVTAVFLDPPYSAEAGRDDDIYEVESADVAHACREWAIERGRDPMMRIALCGYDGEYAMPDEWECFAWKAQGGYGVQNRDESSAGRVNRHRERIWFSPACRRERLLWE